MKKQHPISKKFIPAHARRVTNSEGKRVWVIEGIQFESKREYLQFKQDQRDLKELLAKEKAARENQAPQVAVDMGQEHDVTGVVQIDQDGKVEVLAEVPA